jgi:hypothetical protein
MGALQNEEEAQALTDVIYEWTKLLYEHRDTYRLPFALMPESERVNRIPFGFSAIVKAGNTEDQKIYEALGNKPDMRCENSGPTEIFLNTKMEIGFMSFGFY